MKPWFYAVVLLFIIPVQASLLNPLSLGGLKPDLALVLVFIIGLVTGPAEGTLAGMAIGLVQDIGSASLIGFTGFTRGLVGLASGLLGRRVLDIENPAIMLFLAAFSLAEGFFTTIFLQTTYGAVPVFSLIAGRIVPQALFTGLLGLVLLQAAARKKIIPALKRRTIQKEL